MAQALSMIDDNIDITVASVESMCIQSSKCSAFHLKKEKTTIYCYNGKLANKHVSHPIVHSRLNELFIDNKPNSWEFIKSSGKHN